jgi:aminopeptidase N
LFSTAEINDLRLSFEKITGEDLNWFFNQWYLEGGHPVIDIHCNWNDSLHIETIIINQKQNPTTNPIYKLPLAVDFYSQGKVERKRIVVEDISQQFSFNLSAKPDLVNVDADKILLCEKTENKTDEEYLFQYTHAPLYLDRYEALSKISKNYKANTLEANMMMAALHDKYYNLRLLAIDKIRELALNDSLRVKPELIRLATTDSSSDVREKALLAIGNYYNFLDALKDSSYKVIAQAFKIIADHDSVKANLVAPGLEKGSGHAVLSGLSEFYIHSKDDKSDFYKFALLTGRHYSRYSIIKNFEEYISSSSNVIIISKSVDIFFDQLKRPASKRYKSTLLNSLRSIESSLKKKINDNEEEQQNKKTAKSSVFNAAEMNELKSLRKRVHDKITNTDK